MDRLDTVLHLLSIWLAADLAIVAYLFFVRSKDAFSGLAEDAALLAVAPERGEGCVQLQRIHLANTRRSIRKQC